MCGKDRTGSRKCWLNALSERVEGWTRKVTGSESVRKKASFESRLCTIVNRLAVCVSFSIPPRLTRKNKKKKGNYRKEKKVLAESLGFQHDRFMIWSSACSRDIALDKHTRDLLDRSHDQTQSSSRTHNTCGVIGFPPKSWLPRTATSLAT